MNQADHPTLERPVRNAGETTTLSWPMVVLLPLLWIMVPFNFRRRRNPRHVTWKSIRRDCVPEHVSKHLESFDAEFATIGFQPLGYICCTREYCVYDRSWSHPEMGMVHMAWICSATYNLRNNYPFFEAVRTDGFCIVTTGFPDVLLDENIPELNHYLVRVGEKSLSRMAKLHAVHLKQVKQTHPGEWRSFNTTDEIASWISEWSERELIGHLKRNIYRLAPDDENSIQPTWRASLRWSFLGFPPILKFLRWWRQRRMNVAIRNLETEGSHPK